MFINSEHTVTMNFDMTSEEGRVAFEYARQGSGLSLVLGDLEREMRNCTKYDGAPFDTDDGDIDDGMSRKSLYNSGILYATDYWRSRLSDLRYDYNIEAEL